MHFEARTDMSIFHEIGKKYLPSSFLFHWIWLKISLNENECQSVSRDISKIFFFFMRKGRKLYHLYCNTGGHVKTLLFTIFFQYIHIFPPQNLQCVAEEEKIKPFFFAYFLLISHLWGAKLNWKTKNKQTKIIQILVKTANSLASTAKLVLLHYALVPRSQHFFLHLWRKIITKWVIYFQSWYSSRIFEMQFKLGGW